MIEKSKTAYDPLFVTKNKDNIHRVPMMDGSMQDNSFFGNVMNSMYIRGSSPLAQCKMEQVYLLRECLKLDNRHHYFHEDVCLHELALCDCLMDPGQHIPCVFHHNNKTT